MTYASVIVNPNAGAGKTGKLWSQISQRLKHEGVRFEHKLTEAPGHAIELAKTAAKKGYELVVSVGGDGTINEVVNGIYEAGSLKNVQLGIISTGTGSDYIRTVGTPRYFGDACHRLLSPGKRLVDLGMMEYKENGKLIKRAFVNLAGTGFDAEVVRATNTKYKALGSKASYLMGLLTTFIAYRNKKVTLKLDGVSEDRTICTIMIGNGKYAGGSMLVAPEADPADGLLDVVIINDLDKGDLLRSLPRIYKGTHLTHPKVTLKKVKELEIITEQQMSLQADGEVLGNAPARFWLLPAVLNLAV